MPGDKVDAKTLIKPGRTSVWTYYSETLQDMDENEKPHIPLTVWKFAAFMKDKHGVEEINLANPQFWMVHGDAKTCVVTSASLYRCRGAFGVELKTAEAQELLSALRSSKELYSGEAHRPEAHNVDIVDIVANYAMRKMENELDEMDLED